MSSGISPPKVPGKVLVFSHNVRYYIHVRVFKNTRFARFARKENISDEDLREVVKQLEAGHPDVDYGGDVYKMRIARPGEGKSGGYRVVVFFRSEDRAFFVYGFAKSDRGNIGQGELRAFKNRAKDAFAITDEQIRERIRKGTLIEVF